MTLETATSRPASAVATATALILIIEASALGWLAATFPATPAPVDAALPPAAQIARVEHELLDRLPPFSGRFAWLPAAFYADDRAAVLSPRDDRPLTERVARYNETVASFGVRYIATAALLITSLLVGAFALALTASRGPTPLSLLAPLACCLAVTPIFTEPLVGSDFGAGLLPFVAPMLVGGAFVLLRERAVFRGSASFVGGVLARRPGVLALSFALVLGGAAGVTLALDDGRLLSQIAAVLAANAVIQLILAVVLGVSRLAGRKP